jgi:RNA-directed DNA polymerase
VRYADDIIVGFEHEADAWRFRDAMRERLQEFSLSLNPEKTRLIEFGRHAADGRAWRRGKPETFKFLGFTHICGQSRRGKFLLKRRTRRDRMRAKLTEIKKELRRRMHQPIPEQGQWLAQVMRGFFAYHAVPTNFPVLRAFHHVTISWLHTLQRRNQKDRTTWQRIAKIASDYLPQPATLHPWPQTRFAVHTPKVGAACGNSARAVLCGGRSVTTVPTANRWLHALFARCLEWPVSGPCRSRRVGPRAKGSRPVLSK